MKLIIEIHSNFFYIQSSDNKSKSRINKNKSSSKNKLKSIKELNKNSLMTNKLIFFL
jgi:hypothetical protein